MNELERLEALEEAAAVLLDARTKLTSTNRPWQYLFHAGEYLKAQSAEAFAVLQGDDDAATAAKEL